RWPWPPDLDRPGNDRARYPPRLDPRDRDRGDGFRPQRPGRRPGPRDRPSAVGAGGDGLVEPEPARLVRPVAAGDRGGRADGRSRGADAPFPGALAGAGAVADVRQFDLPGPALPAPADAHAGALLPLPQPGREHAQGTGAALAAAGAVRGQQGFGTYRAKRRARLDRGTAQLPPPHVSPGHTQLTPASACFPTSGFTRDIRPRNSRASSRPPLPQFPKGASPRCRGPGTFQARVSPPQPPLAWRALASFSQVSTTVSGLSETDSIPSSISHCARSGWSLGPWPQIPTYLPRARAALIAIDSSFFTAGSRSSNSGATIEESRSRPRVSWFRSLEPTEKPSKMSRN